VAGDNVALLITDEVMGRTLSTRRDWVRSRERVWNAMQTADCVLVDGTFWTDEEMIGLGLSRKRARDIGHLPQSGPGGMLEWLEKLPPSTRKILIHINNTIPYSMRLRRARGAAPPRYRKSPSDGMEIVL